MSPPAFQRAERITKRDRLEHSFPSPDAMLGDGDGVARQSLPVWGQYPAGCAF
jgi:hypothetical protein